MQTLQQSSNPLLCMNNVFSFFTLEQLSLPLLVLVSNKFLKVEFFKWFSRDYRWRLAEQVGCSEHMLPYDTDLHLAIAWGR